MESQAHKDTTARQATALGLGASNGASKVEKIAYAVTERNGRSFWNRIGVAFRNKDGSLNLKLEAIPVTGSIQLRDPEPRDESPAARGSAGTPASGRGNDTILTELPF